MCDDIHEMIHPLLRVDVVVKLPEVVHHVVAGLKHILQYDDGDGDDDEDDDDDDEDDEDDEDDKDDEDDEDEGYDYWLWWI